MPKILLTWCLKWTPAAFASPLLGKSTTISSIVHPRDRGQSASSISLSQMGARNPSQTSKTQLRIFVGNYPSKRSACLRKETTQARQYPGQSPWDRTFTLIQPCLKPRLSGICHFCEANTSSFSLELGCHLL